MRGGRSAALHGINPLPVELSTRRCWEPPQGHACHLRQMHMQTHKHQSEGASTASISVTRWPLQLYYKHLHVIHRPRLKAIGVRGKNKKKIQNFGFLIFLWKN